MYFIPNYFKQRIILFFFLFLLKSYSNAQCCSGGSSNPIAGGASQGVLQQHQIEANVSYQYFYSDKIMASDKVAKPDTNGNYLYINSEGTPVFIGFIGFSSKYIYPRIAYGLTNKLTLSVEMGYSANKTEYQKTDTISSKGIGDLILFPRYSVFQRGTAVVTELVLGLGLKIPIGTTIDSVTKYFPNGKSFTERKPLGVQPTSGSQDFIFYGFFIRTYQEKQFRLFASALYILKGWNSEGEKIGNYASLGLFASKTFFSNLGVTIQFKGEQVAKAKLNPFVFSSVQPEATGSKKIFFVPQISYTFKRNLTFYALGEIPLYQNLTLIQVASKFAITGGLTYRFFPKKQMG